MKMTWFTEAQIAAILQEYDAGANRAELCRKHGISEATLCAWAGKFGSMQATNATQPPARETWEVKLKRFLIRVIYDGGVMKDFAARKR